MKRVVVTLPIVLNVSNNADIKEVQELLDLLNLQWKKENGQIIGIDNIQNGDISIWD